MFHKIELLPEDTQYLEGIISKGRHPARAIKRARVLLLLNEGSSITETMKIAGVSRATVYNIGNRYHEVDKDVRLSIQEKPRPGQPPKITQERITALACSSAPEGHAGWTLRLLAGKIVELGILGSISHEGVRKLLKKANSSPGKRSSGVSAK